MDIRDKISEILSDIFDDTVVVNDDMKVGYFEDWDSLVQMQIIMELESAFLIKFSTTEIQSLKNMGEYINNIERKIAKN